MECKFDDLGSLSEEYIELIETLWNVNFINVVMFLMKILELIETLWNVNMTYTGRWFETDEELIETLWNVNKHHTQERRLADIRINRNIVECK